MMRTDEGITASERAALRDALALNDERITQAVTWARQAGYERAEIAGVILDAATRRTHSKPGTEPADPLRAAIFRGSPLDADRSSRFFATSMARCGVLGAEPPIRWADIASRRRPRSVHEVALACLADAVDRPAIEAGQGGFAGVGWALPEGEPA